MSFPALQKLNSPSRNLTGRAVQPEALDDLMARAFRSPRSFAVDHPRNLRNISFSTSRRRIFTSS